jgi:raffinose/stachyose/melibiose transport system permease protein
MAKKEKVDFVPVSKSSRMIKTALTVLMSVISIIYVLPVVSVVVNSFKLNTFVKTDTFA